MPKGVEHNELRHCGTAAGAMRNSVMPKGVEHSDELAPTASPEPDAEFSDAERR